MMPAPAPAPKLPTGTLAICPACATDTRKHLGVYYDRTRGWYIGTVCRCGPYSVESERYWNEYSNAELAFKSDVWKRRGTGDDVP